MAASRTILAASTEHFCAPGWKPKMIGQRVFSAISDLKMAVEVVGDRGHAGDDTDRFGDLVDAHDIVFTNDADGLLTGR